MVEADNGDGVWVAYGNTELLKNNDDPEYKTAVYVTYHFEVPQRVRVTAYDVDSSNYNNLQLLDRHRKIGYVEFPLGRLLASPGATTEAFLTKPDGSPRSKARIVIHGSEVRNSKERAEVRLRCKNLPKKGGFLGFGGETNSFVEVCRMNADGSFFVVARTKPMLKTQDPTFPEFVMSWGELSSGNVNTKVRLRVLRTLDGKNELIGEAEMAAGALVKMDGAGTPTPIFPLKRLDDEDGAGTTHGSIYVDRFHLIKEVTFIDYIQGGLDLRLLVAVDFTASNGHPSDAASLHRLQKGSLNQYEQAITSVASIVSNYTEKPNFPAYGFGGAVKMKGQSKQETSHCFPLTLDSSKPEVSGTEGLLAEYRKALRVVGLSGPTNFSEVIQTASVFASDAFKPDSQHYDIVLFLTDGMITDKQQTTDAIVNAANNLPMSIIIVGVGAADFSEMDKLDANIAPLVASDNTAAKRDIVTFVNYREVIKGGLPAVAAKTLRPLPEQIMTYMLQKGIPAMPPRKAVPAAIDPDAALRSSIASAHSP